MNSKNPKTKPYAQAHMLLMYSPLPPAPKNLSRVKLMYGWLRVCWTMIMHVAVLYMGR